jgi:heme O synthase-like polyprenyltransferase
VETEPVLLITSPPATAIDCHGSPGVGRHVSLSDYWALTKPEVNLLIVITTFAGFCLGRPTPSHPFPFLLLIHTLLGTLMVAGGTGTPESVYRAAL